MAKDMSDGIARFLGGLRRGLRIGEACRRAGLSRNFVYSRRKSDPEFAAAWKDAEEAACDVQEDAIWKAGQTDWRAAKFWLQHRSKDRWADAPTHYIISSKDINQTDQERWMDALLNPDVRDQPAGPGPASPPDVPDSPAPSGTPEVRGPNPPVAG